MTDPFDTVREALNRVYRVDDYGYHYAGSDVDAITALASIEERLEVCQELHLQRTKSHDYSLRELIDRAEAAERERDALQHIIDCADTPLMRDVLRERAGLEAALREIAKLPRSGYNTRVEYAGDIGMREKTPKAIARRALCETEKATLCETKSQAGAGLGASPNAQPELEPDAE